MIFVTGDMHGDYKIFKQPIYKNIKKSDSLLPLWIYIQKGR